MPSPFYVLYLIDFVDFFSLIIAVNIGGFSGGIFSVFINMWSRAAGMTPSWLGVAKDSIAQFLTCLVIPFVYVALGNDIFLSMIWYSIIRLIWFFPMRLLPTETSFPQFLVLMGGTGGALLVINAIYARLFGDFLDSLLASGATFSWILFLLATVIILIFYVSVFGKSRSIGITKSLGFIVKLMNKRKKRKKKISSKDNQMDDMYRIRRELQ
jgi:hypothetical protein